MEKSKCFHCDTGNTYEKEFSLEIPRGRKKITASGLLKTACDNCDFESISMKQLDHNSLTIEKLSETTQALIYPGILRDIREKWNLTQRQLSKLFGAGESSVGKWESGATMSTPSALLAQCAMNVPGTIEYLAGLADFSLEPVSPEIDASSQRTVEAIAYRSGHSAFIYSTASNNHAYDEKYNGRLLKEAA